MQARRTDCSGINESAGLRCHLPLSLSLFHKLLPPLFNVVIPPRVHTAGMRNAHEYDFNQSASCVNCDRLFEEIPRVALARGDVRADTAKRILSDTLSAAIDRRLVSRQAGFRVIRRVPPSRRGRTRRRLLTTKSRDDVLTEADPICHSPSLDVAQN